jgi:FixJ family two-component response regulator
MTAGNSHKTLRVAVISAEPQAAENVIHMLQSPGISAERYESPSDWMTHARESSGESHNTALNGSTGDCVLLVGKVDALVEHGATAEIHDKLPGVPVVVVASDVNVEDAVAAMRQGATDVVPLPCPEERLQTAVQHASQTGRNHRQSLKRTQELRDRVSSLGNGELQVLAAMMEGLPNKQIAQTLGIGLRTVELRRSRIMRKMEAGSLAELVRLVCKADVPIAPVEEVPEAAAKSGDE